MGGVGRVGVAMTTTSESNPGVMPTTAEDVPGGAKTLTSKVVGAAAGMVQDLTPVKQFQQVGNLASPSFLRLLFTGVWMKLGMMH